MSSWQDVCLKHRHPHFPSQKRVWEAGKRFFCLKDADAESSKFGEVEYVVLAFDSILFQPAPSHSTRFHPHLEKEEAERLRQGTRV